MPESSSKILENLKYSQKCYSLQVRLSHYCEFKVEHAFPTESFFNHHSTTTMYYQMRVNPVGRKTSTRCLKDVLQRQARHLAKTSCICPKDVLNANLKDIFVRHLQDTFARYIVDVLQKTS